MAKTNWTMGDTVKPEDMNQIGQEINDNAESLENHIGAGGAAHAAATTSSAGFMSAADKGKLDGITSGAGSAGSATDAVIGNRTVSDTTAPTGNTGTLTSLLSWLAYMIKAITGKSNWRTAPATTLEAAKGHMDTTTGAHGATAAATSNTIMQRDASGRAKVAAPAATDDIARKAEVDAVQAALDARTNQDVRTMASPTFARIMTNAGTSGSGSQHLGLHSGEQIRFNIGLNGIENGDNSGSNFSIWSYNDDGSYRAMPFTINRNTGAVTFSGPVSANSVRAATFRELSSFYFEKYVGRGTHTTDQTNKKFDLYWTGGIQGYIDVEVTSAWNTGNLTGRVVKRIVVATSGASTIAYQGSRYVEALGAARLYISIGDVEYDTANSRWRIKIGISNITTNSPIDVHVRGYANGSGGQQNLLGSQLSPVYTTDSTALPEANIFLPGEPTVNTASPGSDSQQIANTAYVTGEVGARSALLTTNKNSLVSAVNEVAMKSIGYGTTAGTGTAYTVSLSPAPTELTMGMRISVKLNAANGANPTINVNSLGAKAIRRVDGTAPPSGFLKSGGVYTLVYDGTNFILQGEGGEYGTAVAADVLAGKTIGTQNGLVTGTMPNNGSLSFTPGPNAQSIPAGYTSGGTVAGVSNLAAGNIKAGVTVGGVAGTFTSDGNVGAGDILNGRVGYTNGQRIVGNLTSLRQSGSSGVPNATIRVYGFSNYPGSYVYDSYYIEGNVRTDIGLPRLIVGYCNHPNGWLYNVVYSSGISMGTTLPNTSGLSYGQIAFCTKTARDTGTFGTSMHFSGPFADDGILGGPTPFRIPVGTWSELVGQTFTWYAFW
ncbi:hypothetical protein [Cohnella algarum]|uniref:hypothetical protein n=1 Tax=Cohnella algarum TaxID=2044859 RepID=UPI0019688637|nr:hypothetical protein [Cohnella algarum]MBN2980100.1 hypothetical protein [Cohnella algarum]